MFSQMPSAANEQTDSSKWYADRSYLEDTTMGDRNTQMMPLRTRRSSTRGTPRGLLGSSYE